MNTDESLIRSSGTPQGGVISPVLANLFMHYAFDMWMKKNYPNDPWARYADDGIAHCKTLTEAESLLKALKVGLEEIGLELHLDKTRIVYCKDDDRKGKYTNETFDFLGYTFRPRLSKSKYGKFFVNFTPAVSNKASKAMRQTIRSWRLQLKPDKELKDIANMSNPVIRGCINYCGRFYKSALYLVLRYVNAALRNWARRKYKKLSRGKRKAEHWLGKIAKNLPKLFAHWQIGIVPTAE
ncbi:RNA-directed DNA polymerase (reverse transcriptase) [Proteiniborus sp. DW1]|uniref:reverse transcriptase domain-containing protein n=1 Tax=Proteiniborus sp. DW1 TaxID=1889883 RepID=UPI00092DEBDE|nr:RNA-directed DNA polymerase (reverse transcriptase) [Proteiniborus sp. DW1]